MTLPAPRLVRLPSPDHDRRAIPEGGPAVDEALVAARRLPAHYANRLELVDDLRDGEQRRHGAEGEAAEIHVDAGEHDPHALVGEHAPGDHFDPAGGRAIEHALTRG